MVILIVLMVAGLPLPFCFFGAAVWMIIYLGYDPSFLIPCGFHLTSSVILLAMPLFILFGSIVEKSGIADVLVSFVNSLVGRIKGGLGVVTVFTSGVFGAMSGAATPAVCAIGTVMIPRMEREGYPRGGAWIIRYKGMVKEITSSGRRFIGIDDLLIPKFSNPKTFDDYTNVLVDNAWKKMVQFLEER